MKIGQVQNNSQNFGSILKTGEAARYIERKLPYHKLSEVDRFVKDQAGKKPDIRLEIVESAGKDILSASIGRVEFRENSMRGILGVIKDAVSHVKANQR